VITFQSGSNINTRGGVLMFEPDWNVNTYFEVSSKTPSQSPDGGFSWKASQRSM
jgi:hypothetical protein